MMGQLKGLYEQAVDNLSQADVKGMSKDVQDNIVEGANTIFDKVRGNPRATAAIVLGAGLAAAALWVLREPQRMAAMKRTVNRGVTQAKQLADRALAKSQNRPPV